MLLENIGFFDLYKFETYSPIAADTAADKR
jgi:hypothetical protein